VDVVWQAVVWWQACMSSLEFAATMAARLFCLGCERRGEEKGRNGEAVATFFTSSWPGRDTGEASMMHGVHVVAIT
jgi:hypothetical protein